MVKTIFVKDDNKVVESKIQLDEQQIQSIISFAKTDANENDLVNLGQELLTEKNVLRLSKIIRNLSDYKTEIEYDRLIKRHLIDSILLENYRHDTILLSEEEMDDIVFLRKLRNFLRNLKESKEERELVYIRSFNKAVQKKVENDNSLDQLAFNNNLASSTLTEDEINRILIKTVEKLPYTKK